MFCVEVVLDILRFPNSWLFSPWLTYYAQKWSSIRKQNKLNKYIETQKEKFTQLDLQDVEVREKIKHCKSKNKKLQKQLEKDKEKVCCSFKGASL